MKFQALFSRISALRVTFHSCCFCIFPGISYLTPVHEAKLREATIKKHELFSSPSFNSPANVSSDPGINKGPVIIPPEQQEFVDLVW